MYVGVATRVTFSGSDVVGSDSVAAGAVAGAVVTGRAEDFGGPVFRRRFRLGPPTNLNSRGGAAVIVRILVILWACWSCWLS